MGDTKDDREKQARDAERREAEQAIEAELEHEAVADERERVREDSEDVDDGE